MVASFSISPIVALGGVALGVWLLRRGLRGRRFGNEPRCPKCGYNLTGTSSDACPECGAATTQMGVVYGARRRRPGFILFGLLLLLGAGTIGGVSVYQLVTRANYYRYYPGAWLVRNAHGGDRQAMMELQRRLYAGSLSDSVIAMIIADGLTEQSAASITPLTQDWVNLLEYLDQAGRLTDDQQQRYHDNITHYSLQTRLHVRTGDPVPIALHSATRGPAAFGGPVTLDRWIEVSLGELYLQRADDPDGPKLNGQVYERGTSAGSSGNGVGGSGYLSLRLPSDGLAPGSYRAVCIADVRIFAAGAGGATGQPPEGTPPVYTRKIKLDATFDVVEPSAGNDIELSTDAAVGTQIHDALSVGPVRLIARHKKPPPFTAMVLFQTGSAAPSGIQLPIDVAFDATLRYAGTDFPLGRVVMRAGTNSQTTLNADVDFSDVDAVDIVLRTDTDAALCTTDITRIWQGELVFKDVPVVH
ncbi:MAG TPA: hypothetical protein P5572_03145 [Phycisphaerae bacterium]|nr:hypothetical protein [Phycisphaerales bacterium]HRX83997.1 hypothetical protein [Phycisphaerae bacterium]